MAIYHVALVQFDGGTKTYPVNGHECHQEGQRVIVEMEWGQKSLAKAVVVGRSFSKKPCRHSIVCREEKASYYGAGPAAVTTKAELDRFMRHVDFQPVTVFSANRDGIETKDQEWSIGYLPKFYDRSLDAEKLSICFSGVEVYLMGPKGVGVCYFDDEDVRLTWVGERLGIVKASRFDSSSLPKNVFQAIAFLGQGELVHEKIPERIDRSISQTRDAISGGGDGPHYLGDGVWL